MLVGVLISEKFRENITLCISSTCSTGSPGQAKLTESYLLCLYKLYFLLFFHFISAISSPFLLFHLHWIQLFLSDFCCKCKIQRKSSCHKKKRKQILSIVKLSSDHIERIVRCFFRRHDCSAATLRNLTFNELTLIQVAFAHFESNSDIWPFFLWFGWFFCVFGCGTWGWQIFVDFIYISRLILI